MSEYNNYKFNPFSGVLEQDLYKIIIPIFDTETLIEEIVNSENIAIEFVGKQGRGKTTHLKYLHKYFNHYPLFLLNSNSTFNEIISNPSSTVFIDSIHHLGIKDRVKLFKSDKNIIFTTHWNRKLECKWAKKPLKSIKFKGINAKTLQELLNKRLILASVKPILDIDKFTIEDSKKLINKFGDNYRGIINHLYNIYK